MATIPATCVVTEAWHAEALETLQRFHLFNEAPESELICLLADAVEVRAKAGEKLVDEIEHLDEFRILLEGKIRASRSAKDGKHYFSKIVAAPSFMGEIPLLSNMPAQMTVHAETDVRFLKVDAQGFWDVMSKCPEVRAAILQEMQLRMQGIQAVKTQQDKLAMLGTMTAGLMHELNNPGAAARRAASQLRSNLQRMHELARGFSERGHSAEQRACLTALQDRVLAVKSESCMSSLQQSDAEEELGEWLDTHKVSKAWEFAPVLVGSGINSADLECLSRVFAANEISEPIEWLEATASSMQMVGLVEDSVARVVELAHAVKSYAHEGQGGVQDVDVNESIHATIVMLKHKLREKNIRMTKEFAANMPKLHCICSGLNQVWTNLLDNAIDAVPANGGSIYVRTSLHGDEVQVSFEDNGTGISPEDRERIFDPFFTTKAAGVGSGMGLGIVRKILESYDGQLTLTSQPGRTEFVVHLPKEQRA